MALKFNARRWNNCDFVQMGWYQFIWNSVLLDYHFSWKFYRNMMLALVPVYEYLLNHFRIHDNIFDLETSSPESIEDILYHYYFRHQFHTQPSEMTLKSLCIHSLIVSTQNQAPQFMEWNLVNRFHNKWQIINEYKCLPRFRLLYKYTYLIHDHINDELSRKCVTNAHLNPSNS